MEKKQEKVKPIFGLNINAYLIEVLLKGYIEFDIELTSLNSKSYTFFSEIAQSTFKIDEEMMQGVTPTEILNKPIYTEIPILEM